MTHDEQKRLEATLREVTPAAPPEELMSRLRAAAGGAHSGMTHVNKGLFHWINMFRGWRVSAIVAPAAAMVLIWLAFQPAPAPEKVISVSTADTANAVQVGHSLVASFDTVAQLPGMEPVRFRCREWEDKVVVHDDAHGVVITKSTPRVEMVPVRFEIY